MNDGIVTLPTQFADPPHDLLGRPTPFPRIDHRAGQDLRDTPSLMSGLELWFDAADLSTLTFDGASVAAWRSKVNGFFATQTTANNRPAYTASGLNSRPSLLFDGTNDALNTDCNSSRITGYATFAAVTRPLAGVLTTTAYPTLIQARSGSNATGMHVVNTTGFIRRWAPMWRGQYFNDANGPPVADAPQRVVLVVSATGLRWRVNAATGFLAAAVLAGTNLSANFAIGIDTAGASRFWHGHISELLLWRRPLGALEQAQLESYLSQKWAITT